MSTPNDDLLRQLLLEKYEPIAIVGVGLRLPGGNDSRAGLAEFLRSGSSATGPIPTDRWDVAAFASTDPTERGKIRTEGGGFLTDIDRFDPTFFGISPKEAGYVDPQQRLILETAWEALEDAGLDATAMRGAKGGIYVGVSSADYMVSTDSLPHEELDGYLGTGTAHSAVSGRLSYFLGWHGPCVSVDTACSSSLVALHMAVQDLRQRQSDVALCGAVSLILHPQAHIVCTQANMLAPDGRCKTFDDSADGYSRSEGVGMLALKRMSDARRDGDRILGLVRGCAIRQDGESGGLTVPNGQAQQRVMRAALENSALRPADVQYVEAHGTGTAIGDPIEVDAIASVFAESHDRDDPLLIGSVKTNLGHAEPAAGVTGIIKTLLQLEDQQVYPHLNMVTPSSRIDWAGIPVRVPTQVSDWPAAPTRRALVNSFGFAGTIASAVIEQAPVLPAVARHNRGPAVFTLSAKTRRALRGQVERYRQHVADHPDLGVDAFCHASNVTRAHLPARIAGVVGSRDDLLALLAEPDGSDIAERRQFRKVAFLFTGQGAQQPGMGADLYQRHQVFADTVDECDRLFAEQLDGVSIRSVMFGDGGDGLLDQTRYTQPALFTLEYSLATLWASWGIRPDVLIGHSIGEVIAAAFAGVLSLPDAVTLVATRARLMQSVTTAGGMAAVRAPVERVLPLLAGHPDLAVAAINGPDQCVISGASDALAAVCAELELLDVRSKPLPVSHAFHSPLMDEVADEFRAALARLKFADPEIALVSNRTGTVVTPGEVRDPEYWVGLIREPVNFAAGMRSVAARGQHAMVEIGPGRTLVNAGRQCVPAGDHLWVPSLDCTAAAAELYVAGLPVAWPAFHDGRPKPQVTLPTYAFDRKRYWLPAARKASTSGGSHPLLGAEISSVEQRARGEREFAGQVSPDSPGYLADHRVGGQVVFPAAGFIELLVAALDAVRGDTRRPIRDLVIHEALFLSDTPTTVHTRVRQGSDGTDELEIFSLVGDTGVERRHVRAVAEAADGAELRELAAVLSARADAALTAEDAVAGRVEDLYADFTESDMHYGPEFRLIRSFVRHDTDLAVAELTGPAGVPAEHLPPAVLDAALQTLATVIQPGLPVRLRSFQLLSRPRGADLRGVVRLVPADPAADVDYVADVLILDSDRAVCVLTGLELRHVVRATGGHRRKLYHQLAWTERPVPTVTPGGHRLVLLHSGLDDERDFTSRAEQDGVGLAFADNLSGLPALLADRPTDVCWFWQPGAGTLAQECERQHTELLDLVRLLEQHGFGPGQRLWLVTRGAQRVPGDVPGDGSRLAAATAWGFGNVLANEYPNYHVTLLDLPPEDPDPQVLLTECLAGRTDELQVAYRGEQRHIRRLESFEPTEPTAQQVDGEHTYLITGGFGGLGPDTARTLVELGARHLALVGRRRPADADLAAVRAELGPEVTVLAYAADIAEAADMTALFAAIAEDGPPLGGVVHAAGVLADKPVNAQTWANFDTVFRAKVHGSWLLHQATADLPDVRFFVGYASSSTVFGQAGQANYAAGNAFLDELMHWRTANGLPGIALDWGPWAEVGMAAELSDQRRTSFLQQGMTFVSPRDGRRALAALLHAPAPQVVVGECDWTRFAATRPLPSALYEVLARPAEGSTRTVDLTGLTDLAVDARLDLLTDLVRGTIADVLHFDATDEIPADTSFPNLGLDSLAAVEVKNKLEAALNSALPVSITFDYPNAAALAVFLDSIVVPDTGDSESDWDLADADAELATLKEFG
ncbi:MAG TPA: type I polyketide synthase [Pseudonocardiaceae bacterium]